MQDLEFTVERGRLYMLQTRTGKRSAAAAIRIAVEMEEEGLIDRTEAVMRVEPDQLNQLLHPMIDPRAPVQVLTVGLPAAPGAASGLVVFNPEEAAEFVGKMQRHHNVCELAAFEGRDGNFYNFNVDPVSYEASLVTMDDFLDRHGLFRKGETHESPQIISWRERDY